MEVNFNVTHMVDEKDHEFIEYYISTPTFTTSFILDMAASQVFLNQIQDIMDHREEAMEDLHRRRAGIPMYPDMEREEN